VFSETGSVTVIEDFMRCEDRNSFLEEIYFNGNMCSMFRVKQ
jgi:hypothetical protein